MAYLSYPPHIVLSCVSFDCEQFHNIKNNSSNCLVAVLYSIGPQFRTH